MIYSSIQEMIQAVSPPQLPVVIPTFNNPSYLSQMINQLAGYELDDIIILDNFSSYPDMHGYLDSLGQERTVVRKITNDGPKEFYHNSQFLSWLPEYFIITDPDIGFNQRLPRHFVQTLKDVSNKHNMMRVGFALDIEMEGTKNNLHDITFGTTNMTMYQWEKRFWHNKIGSTLNGDPIFRASIDTTFCLFNKKNNAGNYYLPSARIGGDFTAQHYGWYENPPIPEKEFEYYLNKIPRNFSETGNAIKRKNMRP